MNTDLLYAYLIGIPISFCVMMAIAAYQGNPTRRDWMIAGFGSVAWPVFLLFMLMFVWAA